MSTYVCVYVHICVYQVHCADISDIIIGVVAFSYLHGSNGKS